MFRTIRGYSKTGAMAAAAIIGDSALFLIDYLLRFMRVALLLAIWRTVFADRREVSGLPLSAVLTYTLIAEVFAEPLSAYSGLTEAYWDGTITARLMRPLNLFGQFAAESGGQWAFNFMLFSAPLLVCAPLFGVNPLPAGPLSAALFVVSLALATSVGLAIDYISGGVAVGLGLSPFIIERTRRAIGGLLAGAIIPFALLPWGLGPVLAWTPFASLGSAPLQMYIGRGDPLRLIGLQLFWAIVLWPLAARIWTSMREKMVTYGG